MPESALESQITCIVSGIHCLDLSKASRTIKMKPSFVKKARIRAVSSDRRLAEWLEEAIEEKIAREDKKKQRQK